MREDTTIPDVYLRAVECARMFLKEGSIASVQYRARPMDSEYKSDNGDEALASFPLLVLVNSTGRLDDCRAHQHGHHRAADETA